MLKIIQRFFYGWIFLTKLPAPPLPEATKEDWGRIAPYFVLIGFIIGFILYFFTKLLIFFKLPIMFSALLILLIWNLITGCLHLDGLMDTFDGINCQDESRKIEAMKDSRIGAFGAIAGIFIILFKLVCLCTIILNKSFFVIVLAPPIARLATVYSFTFLSQNQKSGISSSLILSGVKKPFDLSINLLIFVIISFLIFIFSPLSSHFSALIFIFISIFACLIWAYWLNNHFKGHSGDTYGALIELSEVTILLLGVLLKQFLVWG